MRTTVIEMGHKRYKRSSAARARGLAYQTNGRLAAPSDQEKERGLAKREKKKSYNRNYYFSKKLMQTRIATEEVSESERIDEPGSSFLCTFCRRVKFDRREELLEHIVTHL